ncbi:MAG: hypothetical protein LBI74_10640 [Synergistaceae bacterium]|jgi:hypothetical protein|nr:hypothetical protein [Synergistaceae bacterium]
MKEFLSRKLDIAVISIFIVLMLTTAGGVLFWYVRQAKTTIRMPKAAKELKGENYQDVITLLETAGFTNVKTEVLSDLVTGWLTKDGEVERVSVNGETDFSRGKFPVDAKIVITYHTFSARHNAKPTSAITPERADLDKESLLSYNTSRRRTRRYTLIVTRKDGRAAEDDWLEVNRAFLANTPIRHIQGNGMTVWISG